MTISKNCIDIVKHYERFYANPYLCPGNHATIGYGTTVYENGKIVRLTDPAITEPEAIELLMHDLKQSEKDVNFLLKVQVTQGQFDALVSFAYNVGSDIDKDDIAEGLGDSTLLKYINRNIMQTDTAWKRIITIEFCKWIYAGGKKQGGLIARRQSEALLFCDNLVKFFN
jgi:lysozyme